MTTKLGTYTFPHDPERFMWTFPRELKTVLPRKTLPIILNFGPMVDVLKFFGILAARGVDAQTAWTNYVQPLLNMAEKGFFIPVLMNDDGMASDFSAFAFGTGVVGDATLSDDTTEKIKGVDSLKIVVPSGTSEWSGGYRSSIGPYDWSLIDFIWYWIYGLNNAGSISCRLSAPDGSNWFEYDITDNFSGWKRIVIHREEFIVGGGSPTWKDIRQYWILFNTVGTRWFDRWGAGSGYYLDAPGTRYDGVYLIKKLSVEESFKIRQAYPYEIDLWNFDEYY